MTETIRIFCVDTMTFNSWLGIMLYWAPLGFCMVGYTIRTFRNVQDDIRRRRTQGFGYSPTDTIGTLIGRALVTLVPVANLWAGLFDLGPTVFQKLYDWLGDTFNQPLVPPKKKQGEEK